MWYPLAARISAARLARQSVRGLTSPAPAALRHFLAPARTVLCYPNMPSVYQAFAKIAAFNGYRLTSSPREPFDVAMHYARNETCRLPAGVRVINREFTDLSKTFIARSFGEVFGYGLEVDPCSHAGPMCEKSDDNNTHDGREIDGPIASEDVVSGKVYQRLVSNLDGDEAVDLRVPLYGGEVPLVYVKRRPRADRFSNENSSVTVAEPDAVFSVEELSLLSGYAKAIGLDYGEVDVLRDRDSGLIYVVDATNRPAGPPNGLARRDARRAVHRLASAFDAMLERPAA